MKLTAFTDYSLRVLIYLAARPADRATIAAIANSFGIKENHLTKVVHALGKGGWLLTVRGKGGGLELAMPASRIVLGDVVRHAEGEARPAECFEPGNRNCSIGRLCRLHDVLGEAVHEFYKVLDAYTLADLVRNREALAQVMFVDPAVAARSGASGQRDRVSRPRRT